MTGALRAAAVAALFAGTVGPTVGIVAAPSPSPLPDIGRTRAIRLPCSVIRDLVAPSVGAALDGTTLFNAAKDDIHKYGLIPGVGRPSSGARTMALMRIDRKKAALAKDVAVISKALGDARVSKDQTDPGLLQLRNALADIYAAQNERLNALSNFVENEHWSALFNEDESLTKVRAAAGGSGAPGIPRALVTPAPFAVRTPVAVPVAAAQNPDAFAALLALASPAPEDRLEFDHAAVAQREAAASKAIAKVAETCR